MTFLRTLQANFQHAMLYENPELQIKARTCIPHQQLSSTAKEKLQQAIEEDPGKTVTDPPPLFSPVELVLMNSG